MLLIKQYFFPTFKLFQQNKKFSEQQEHAEMQCATLAPFFVTMTLNGYI